MVWVFGVALIVAGALVTIYAMQDLWPIAPLGKAQQYGPNDWPGAI